MCLKITGNPVLAGFTAPKIKWMQKNEPEIFKKVSKILLPKDYIRYRLTGEFFSDVSDASGTSLLNVGERKWSEEITACLRLGSYPGCRSGYGINGNVGKSLRVVGPRQPVCFLVCTPVAAGGGDCAAQAVGSAIVEEGKVSVTLGTSGVVFAQSDEYRVEPERANLHAFCHARYLGKWHLMGVMLICCRFFSVV